MSFLYPYVLIALALPLVLAGLAFHFHRRKGQAWKKLVSPAHMHELVHALPAWRTAPPVVLALLALACVVLAGARPINGYSDSGAVATGRNIFIALDVSRSMETQDVIPSRLQQAKAAATELINALPTDKIGLMVFSGEADTLVPLTYDHGVLLETLDQADRTWVEYGGTNLADVLSEAQRNFRRSGQEGTKALIILSDGEETEDSSLQNLAQAAKEDKVLIMTVGVGTTKGAVIPDPHSETGVWKDEEGQKVISKLHTENLEEIARQSGGDFVVVDSGTSLSDFARHAVRNIDRHEENGAVYKTPNDLFMYFAWAGVILLLAAILLATEWKLPKRAALVAAAMLLLGALPTAAAADDDDDSEVLEGADGMTCPQHYAAGIQYLKAGKTKKAKASFSRAMLSENQSLQAASLYALTNIRTQEIFGKLCNVYRGQGSDDGDDVEANDLEDVQASLQECIEAYREVMELDPSLKQAQANITKIEALLESMQREIDRLKELEDNREDDEEEDDEEEDKKDKKNDKGKKSKKNQKQNGQQQQGDQQQNDQQQQQGDQQQDQDQPDKPTEQQQQNGQQQQQSSQGQQQDSPQDRQESRQEKLEDLNKNLQDEIDRLKQQQQEKRTPQERIKDAEDLVKDLQEELEKLKKENGGQNSEPKQEDGKKEEKKGLDKAMDLSKDLRNELHKMENNAFEQHQDLTPEEERELEKAREQIRELQKQISMLRIAQKNQQETQEEGEAASMEDRPEVEKEKTEQRAESLLRMNLDEEVGSPIPRNSSRNHSQGTQRRPRKDY